MVDFWGFIGIHPESRVNQINSRVVDFMMTGFTNG